MKKKEEHIAYWIESAENDLRAAENMMLSKNYDWALFVAHLSIEKVLKAIYIHNTKELVPPRIHNLARLADYAKVKLDKDLERYLIEANIFHIEGRYPNIKQEFYKTCTSEYADEHFNKLKEIFQWLKSLLK